MRVPTSTYRLQLTPSFTFQSAKEVIPYLYEFGISDIYVSPVFRARKGSQHGYDVTDTDKINPELGGELGFEELISETQRFGMGWLQDIVSNHMAYDYENSKLMDVLENGDHSPYFDFFDILWDHPAMELRGRLLAPFLGKDFEDCLERGEITLEFGEDGFTVYYYEQRFPLAVCTYEDVLGRSLHELQSDLGECHPDFLRYKECIDWMENDKRMSGDLAILEKVAYFKKTLWQLYISCGQIRSFIERNVHEVNSNKVFFGSLLCRQKFLLSHWKEAMKRINYRRFFDINGLISLNTQDISVFERMHAFLFDLIKRKKVTGLRVDHIDGLYNPGEYLRRVREEEPDVYLVVEKILAPGENLPVDWPVQGTTGYDFLNCLNGLFCKRGSEVNLNKTYKELCEVHSSYLEILYKNKKMIAEQYFAGDVENLVHLAERLCKRSHVYEKVSFIELKKVLIELVACFPVYRTYISPEGCSEQDARVIQRAIEGAIKRNKKLNEPLHFFRDILTLNCKKYKDIHEREALHFTMRFQQFTGPVMAKGLEDTTLYVYNRFISSNEVGGDPDKTGVSVDEFHNYIETRSRIWPRTLNATSTHDTKRGEDVRARLNVLTELTSEWEKQVKKWMRTNESKKDEITGKPVPDGNDEYFLYQTLIGAFPFLDCEHGRFVERMKSYVVKMLRESKRNSSWIEPCVEYEKGCIEFIERIFSENQFMKEFVPFQKKIAYYGIWNSLSQTLIKLTAPGIPDIYQGSELWDLNLVDPDNRLPVDFNKRMIYLKEIKEGILNDLIEQREDGRIKLYVVSRVLTTRKKHKEIFQEGCYVPLKAGGEFGNHVIAYGRQHESTWGIVIVPRFLTSLVRYEEVPTGENIWKDTYVEIPQSVLPRLRDVFTNQSIEAEKELIIHEVLNKFPVSLLVSSEEPC